MDRARQTPRFDPRPDDPPPTTDQRWYLHRRRPRPSSPADRCGATMPEATLGAMSTTVKPSRATAVPSTVRRWPAALTLAVAAPLIAEISLGSLPVSKAWMLPFFGYIYSAGALLIREAVRRRHLGVGSILALGLAFAPGRRRAGPRQPDQYHALPLGRLGPTASRVPYRVQPLGAALSRRLQHRGASRHRRPDLSAAPY
jgi:hypothetical protein